MGSRHNVWAKINNKRGEDLESLPGSSTFLKSQTGPEKSVFNVVDHFELDETLARSNKNPFQDFSSYWWLAYFRIGYYLGLLPLQINQDWSIGGLCYIQRNKLQLLLHSLLATASIGYLIWTTYMKQACLLDQSYLGMTERWGDFGKLGSQFYISWLGQDNLLRIINTGLTFDNKCNYNTPSYWSPGNKVKYTSLLVMGSYIVYTSSSIVYGDVKSLMTSNSSLSSYHYGPCPLFPDKPELERIILSLLVVPAEITYLFVLQGDLLFIATIGMYCQLVDDTRDKIQRLQSYPYPGKNLGYILQVIEQFQAQVERINKSVQVILLIIVTANLPFYILTALPSILQSGFSHASLRRMLYLIGFFGSLLISGIKNGKLQEEIREWVSKTLGRSDQESHRLQALLWDLNASRNFTLNLAVFGQFNTSLFTSITSVTLTYTLIYYQFKMQSS